MSDAEIERAINALKWVVILEAVALAFLVAAVILLLILVGRRHDRH